jgi:ribosomal-protein-alanine N-acetyltransferase
MRTYQEKEKKELQLQKVICNQCGKELQVENGVVMEGHFHSEYAFGYFSRKDGQVYSLDLCEDCFDAWIKGFKEPVQITEMKEFL